MTIETELGALLRTNAWCGDAEAVGTYSREAMAWALRGAIVRARELAPEAASAPALDLADWRSDRVGWGVVLPDRDGLSDADKAAAVDAPAAIRRLIAARGNAPVFRYKKEHARDGFLLRHFAHRAPARLRASGQRGVRGDAAVPRYLLIVGSPGEIPWSFQYRLQTDAFVGRLDLDEEGLERYVDALSSGWHGSRRSADKPLLWSVDHGHPDITYLMRKTIAEKLQEAFVQSGFDAQLLTDAQATHAQLNAALAERQPAFVLSTSHGATFPLDDAAKLRAQLGLLVDRDHALLDIDALLQQWQPAGAIWYAHACCSAGADKPSTFQKLVDASSSLGRMLGAVAQIGPCTAALPRALLGAAQPLAAFIGHVEPTFDWTLRDPDNGQRMTDALIIDTLFTSLHAARRTPVGMAMDGYYDAVAGLLLDHIDAVEAFNNHEAGAEVRAMKAKLMAMDRLGMVILGDPTVAMP
ncbi:hypothetical protein DFR29_116106 [Tahibacter aquaticus]|uniref:Uncharacterized protein n=1 Tax=Tahibacter aquaticus TaxID=520092 RepID=A0A4R6YP03_9GAMM|nr:hypothetical protein [Tahibacter aquaticus]TDR39405.1 hypothetical protein DFR29_116106 [Tahibacter aquaticus]